jgi:hypothetical protein
MIKLFDHLVSAAGVSPDGCKIAYANNDFTPETREYVQVINLCEKGHPAMQLTNSLLDALIVADDQTHSD